MHLIPLFRLWKWYKTIPALTKEQLEQESNLGPSAYKRAVCNSTLLQYNTCQMITGQLGRSVAHQGRYDIPKSREGEVDLCSLLEALTLGNERTQLHVHMYINQYTLSVPNLSPRLPSSPRTKTTLYQDVSTQEAPGLHQQQSKANKCVRLKSCLKRLPCMVQYIHLSQHCMSPIDCQGTYNVLKFTMVTVQLYTKAPDEADEGDACRKILQQILSWTVSHCPLGQQDSVCQPEYGLHHLVHAA